MLTSGRGDAQDSDSDSDACNYSSPGSVRRPVLTVP